MQFTKAISLLLTASTSFAALLPRQSNTTTPSLESDSFILHSRFLNDTTSSLGYLHAEYGYPPGYGASLHTNRSDAITGLLSDSYNATDSSLVLGSEQNYGFVLNSLSQTYPRSTAQIYSGQMGTKGVYIDDAGLLGWASGGAPVSWYACPNQTQEWGSATVVWYKWSNVTTPSKCFDIELAAEYV